MIKADDVPPAVADQIGDHGEEAGAVVASEPHRYDPLLPHEFPGEHGGEEAAVDIAAAEDQADLLPAEELRMRQKRGEGGGARAFRDRLLHIAVEGDGRFEVGLFNQHHVFDQGARRRIGQIADLLHGDTLGDGLAAQPRGDIAPAGGEGRIHGRLDADDADVRL